MLALYSAVALLASYASATIVLSTPTNATSGFPITITWTSQVTDPSSFTLELSNPNLFHQSLAVGNNLGTSLGTVSFTIPAVPADDNYTLLAVNISNVNQLFGQSGTFAIAVVSTTTTATTSSGSSGSLTAPTLTTPGTSSPTTTPFGSTVSPTTNPSTSGTQSGQSSGSDTSTSSPTPFNGSNSGDATSLTFSWASWVLTGAAAVFGGILAL